MNQVDQFLGRPGLIGDLSDDLVLGLMMWLKERGRSAVTCNKARQQLVAIWNFLAKKRLLDTWPDVMQFTEPERSPIAWLPDELRRIWAACETARGFIGGVPANNWWHALHAVAWDSGERISAMLGLHWEYVDLTGGWINFPAEVRKGKKRDKLVKLHPDTVALLEKIRRPTGHVFPWDRCSMGIWLHYGRLLKRAGLPNTRKHKFHCMRKSVASYCEAVGGNATALLDHSDRKVTIAYLDLRIVGQQHAADLLFRPNQPPPPPGAETRAG
jgi:integrase